MKKMNGEIEKLEWFYHAEGDANIILKNRQCGLALRIRKTYNGIQVMHNKHASTLKVEEEFNYFNMIVKPLFRDFGQYLVESHIQFISKEFAERISLLIDSKRPKQRKVKFIPLRGQSVLVMPFLGKFKCEGMAERRFVSVEFKPKWVFLPFSQHIKTAHDVKREVCRFCLHQILKMKATKVKEISRYCPLDLYGSCICRVKHAVKSLFTTPQNNLAISVDGQRIPVNELEQFFKGGNRLLCNNKEDLMDLIVDVFFRDSNSFAIQQIDRNRVCAKSNFLRHAGDCKNMGRGGVLNVLRKLQSFDDLDIEFIGELLETAKIDDVRKHEFSNYNSNAWKNFIENTGNIDKEDAAVSIDETETMVCKYLISSTFKDCTIIMTLCSALKDEHIGDGIHCYQSSFGWINYQIKLVDLDPRLVENIPYYHTLDHEIVSTYLTEMTGSPCCS